MTTKNDGGSAFPDPAPKEDGCMGMNIRDYFAGLAMQGIHASATNGEDPVPYLVAAYSYKMADAMIVERAKP